jgi:hypothetical protein
VDQVLSSGSSAHSSAFMYVTSLKDIDTKLDNVTKQLSNLYATMLSSRSGVSNRTEGEGRGRGAGRSACERGKENNLLESWGGIIIFYSALELY